MRPWMRQGQFRGVDDLPAEVDEIDVDRPGPVPNGANPPEIILDRMHPAGEVKRLERRFENRDLIEELERGEFRRNINRFGLNDGTRAHKSRLGQGRQRSNRPIQIVRPRLQVRPEGDNGPFTWPLGVRP